MIFKSKHYSREGLTFPMVLLREIALESNFDIWLEKMRHAKTHCILVLFFKSCGAPASRKQVLTCAFPKTHLRAARAAMFSLSVFCVLTKGFCIWCRRAAILL